MGPKPILVSETSATTTPAAAAPSRRYLASDFQRLTNRIRRRISSPRLATPDSTIAQGPRAAAVKCTKEVENADKRAISTSASRTPSVLRPSHGSRQSSSSSISVTSGPSLKQCVAEDDHGVAQSFLESVNASISPPAEPVKLDATSPISPLAADTCECCCRCGRSSKWKPLGKSKQRSKSYTALRTGISELSGWDSGFPKTHEPRPIEVEKHFRPGEAPLEKLPVEVLDDVIAQLALDLPPSGYAPRNVDLIACLLTSKTLHVATINTLYKHITVPHSSIFSKFLNHLSDHPGLGTLVRRLDLSHFTSVGLGRSRQSNSEIQNLTSKTLLKCLQLTPAIQEVLLQENLDDDIDERVLHKLFFDLPKLRAVDFCASASLPFVDAFTAAVNTFKQSPGRTVNLKRLSLHECFTLPSATFDTLLPRLPQLTHLDLSHTRITNRALASIPDSAQLTHLSLGRCSNVTGSGVADFLSTHPAAQSLVYLNLSCDITRYRLLYEADVDRILPALPSTLRSLNLNGAQIVPRHIPHLLPLTRHLEELGLASADLSLADVNALFRPPSPSHDQQRSSSSPATTATTTLWTPPTVHYIDLSSIPAITQSSLFNTPAPTNILLHPSTYPLEVIELGDKAISSLRECKNTNKRLGWCVKELGRRGWYVREPMEGGRRDGGRRAWKMGAMWWGMRKCPVAWGEVGGLYGHYMFKK